MLLTELEARNFRNLRGNTGCGPGLNILLGDNGQGKTSWLEAIHLLATTRSFRTAKLSEAIAFDETSAMVAGKVSVSDEIHHQLRAVLEGNSKAFSVNGKRETIQRYLGELHSVVFNADELEVVRGTPEHRRRFLDDSITAIHPPYVQTIGDYSRVLRQKNSLLQTARDREVPLEKVKESLAPWNEQLAAIASKVHRSRARIVERLNAALAKGLFGEERITIRYASSLEEKGDLSEYEALIAERLEIRVPAELVAGHSLIGPHRDDLEISLNGREIRKFGSSGQQRSALLLLQLANIEIFFEQRGEYPLFLLDDIDAELDYRRIGQLLEYLAGRTQTFVTTSKESFSQEFGSLANILRVVDGGFVKGNDAAQSAASPSV
ncbi:MAG: DNA replication and repair protein RecF [Pyrinomonadaceae bacterium]